jgi:hypothetical protein
MEEIKSSIQINATIDKVWDIVSDLDRESGFWHNISKTRNLSTEGNVVKREITIGKGDRCLQTVTLYPKEKVLAEFTKGIINGTKTITLASVGGGTSLEIAWNIKFTRGAGFMKGMLIKSFQQQTDDVVQIIKQESENGRPAESRMQMEERKHWADLIDTDK